MILRISNLRGATVQGAEAQLKKNPGDKRAMRRLALALTGSCSTEEGTIVAEF